MSMALLMSCQKEKGSIAKDAQIFQTSLNSKVLSSVNLQDIGKQDFLQSTCQPGTPGTISVDEPCYVRAPGPRTFTGNSQNWDPCYQFCHRTASTNDMSELQIEKIQWIPNTYQPLGQIPIGGSNCPPEHSCSKVCNIDSFEGESIKCTVYLMQKCYFNNEGFYRVRFKFVGQVSNTPSYSATYSPWLYVRP